MKVLISKGALSNNSSSLDVLHIQKKKNEKSKSKNKDSIKMHMQWYVDTCLACE